MLSLKITVRVLKDYEAREYNLRKQVLSATVFCARPQAPGSSLSGLATQREARAREAFGHVA